MGNLKNIKKYFILTLVLVFSFAFLTPLKSASAASRDWVDLGSGHKAGFDEPHDKKTGHWHVHVYKGNKQVASENMDGSKHDGSTLKDAPNAVVKKLKSTSKWDKYKKKESELKKARENTKNFSWSQLVLNPGPIYTLAIALGITFWFYTLNQWKAIIF